jgi:hypothetical protein
LNPVVGLDVAKGETEGQVFLDKGKPHGKFHAVLDLVFPEYHGVFGDLFSQVSLNTLLAFPTPEAVLKVSQAE